MSTDHKNQKFCRVPLERDAEFLESIPAEGSVYFRPATTTLVVGDGATPGGIEFVSRQWVIQKIAEANWKAKVDREIVRFSISALLSSINTGQAYSYFQLSSKNILFKSTASGSNT